jgi:hypothetical protein
MIVSFVSHYRTTIVFICLTFATLLLLADEAGDLSKEIDARVKKAVVEFCGKESGQCKFGGVHRWPL